MIQVTENKGKVVPMPSKKTVARRQTFQNHPFSLVTVAEAARLLDVSPQRIRFLLASGRLAGTKNPGGQWTVRLSRLTSGRRGPRLLVDRQGWLHAPRPDALFQTAAVSRKRGNNFAKG